MDHFLKGFEQVPPSFEVLAELCSLLRNPYVELSELVRLISIDPSLSASVVRLSNCAYFGCKSPSMSIEEAVQRIGLTEVIKLVGLVSRRTFAAYPLQCYGTTPGAAWKEALGAAVLMEYLAYHADEEPGTAYLAGLLHGVGFYPIARLMARVKPTLVCPRGVSHNEVARWEREQVGVDHPRVGCNLLRQWNFADEIAEPVGTHLHPFLAPRHRRLSCLLHIVVMLVPALLDRSLDVDAILARIPPGILKATNVSGEVLASCVEPARAWLRSTDELLEKELQTA